MTQKWISLGAFLLALAVAIGAFGAHGLKDRLDAYSLSTFEKANFYHFIHALGVFVVGVIVTSGKLDQKQADIVAWLLFFGILLFSGSLYALALSQIRILGAITPFGGVSFIVAWLLLGYYSWKG